MWAPWPSSPSCRRGRAPRPPRCPRRRLVLPAPRATKHGGYPSPSCDGQQRSNRGPCVDWPAAEVPSSRGLGHHPLKVETRVRIPLGLLFQSNRSAFSTCCGSVIPGRVLDPVVVLEIGDQVLGADAL